MDRIQLELQLIFTVAGRSLRHNDRRWTVLTNRHTSTDGSYWGWIEGADGNECWSNNKPFNEAAACEAARAHNAWLEEQAPLATISKLTSQSNEIQRDIADRRKTLAERERELAAIEKRIAELAEKV